MQEVPMQPDLSINSFILKFCAGVESQLDQLLHHEDAKSEAA